MSVSLDRYLIDIFILLITAMLMPTVPILRALFTARVTRDTLGMESYVKVRSVNCKHLKIMAMHLSNTVEFLFFSR